MVWTRKKALKDTILSIIFQYSVLFIVLLRGFLFTKYLGPEGYGLWASIYLIYTYGQYSHLGLFTATALLVPAHIGKGDFEESNKLLSVAITYSNIFGIIFFVIISIFSITGISAFFYANNLPIILISIAVPLFLNFNFFINKFQYHHNFKKAGKYQLLLNSLDLILSFTLLKVYGLTGVFIGMVLSLSILIILMGKEGYKNIILCFDKEIFKKMLKLGFLLLVISFSFAIFTTADKLSVANFFSKIEMGFFSNAVAFAMLPYTVALVISGIVSQRMIEVYGKSNNPNEIKIFIDESITAIAFLIPFFSILLIAFAEPAIYILLPKYISSLRFVDKLSIGVYFLAIGLVCYNYAIIRKKYFFVIILIVLLTSLILISNYYISMHNLDIIGVSYVSVIGYFFFALLLYFFIYTEYYSYKRIIWMFIKLSMPVIPLFIAFSMKFAIVDNISRILLRVTIAFIWAFFAYYYLRKKTVILSQLSKMIKDKFYNSINL